MKQMYYLLTLKVNNLKCLCLPGYFGVNCQHELTCGNCEGTICIEDNRCQNCKKGWGGKSCIDPDCESIKMCGKNGKIFKI